MKGDKRMRKMKRMISACLVIMLVAGCLMGCGGSEKKEETGSGEPKNGGTLVVGISQDPQSFNPNAKSDDVLFDIGQNIFSRLIKLNNKQELVPDLAEKWEVSEDGKQITFHLREGVKWHDGEKFTSKDVKWTFDQILNENGQIKSNLSAVESIEAPDEHTVVFKLSKNDANLLSYLGWNGCLIMPAHLYEGTDWLDNPANKEPVGTGPFKFVKYESGVSVTLERNDEYFGQVPYLDKIVYSIIPDENTALQAFYNGELDILGVNPPLSELKSLEANQDLVVGMQQWPARYQVAFNVKNGVFADQKLRQAVAYGVDKDAVIEKALKGAGKRCDQAMVSLYKWALNTEDVYPERDVEKARKLIEEAGYTADENGMYFSVELDAWNEIPYSDIGTVIKDNLKEIGIDVKLNITEMAAWNEKVWINHDYDIAILGGFQGPDAGGLSLRFASDGSMNIYEYKNDKMDQVLADGRVKVGEEERRECYVEAQRLLVEDLPMVPLSEMMLVTPYYSYVKGHPLDEDTIDKVGYKEYTYVWLDK